MMMTSSISPVTSVATHSKQIGIIIPPPEVARIIIKTAENVAKHGPEFENMIINDKIKLNPDPKFTFLKSSHPYHAYYQKQVAEIRAKQPDQCSEKPAVLEAAALKPESSSQFRPECKVPEAPEPEQYSNVQVPEGISEETLDAIKLTAQFAARNGESFLVGLRDRERNNSQFCFLNSNHSLFTFFTSLRDAYAEVLMPPKGLVEKLKKSATDMRTVLERCVDRLEWEQYQQQTKEKAEDEIEQERLAMAAIDWDDHVVVEVIDFYDEEDGCLPLPLALEEVLSRSKDVTYMEANDAAVEMDLDEEETQLVEEGMEATEPMRIVKNWKRPEERNVIRCRVASCISPISGELVPNSEMSEHMRISLIDPRYKEQKERMFAKIQKTNFVLAQDEEISRNIENLARTHRDIFGSTEEEVSNAVKAEIANKEKQHALCNSHAGSIGPLADQPMSGYDNRGGNNAAVTPAANLLIVPANTVQYRGTNNIFLPMESPMFHPPMPTMSMPVATIPVPPPDFTTMQMIYNPPPPLAQALRPPTPPHPEPKPKRPKLDDSMLIPEAEFLAQHPGPVGIKIHVPKVDEGNLRGQVLEITLQSLSETVGSLKEKISGEIQLLANKQKLSGNLGFLKDSLPLAFYNVGSGETLAVTVRERGGRKR